MKNAWYKAHLTDGRASLPFSFTYDGQPSAALLAAWPVRADEERLDAHRTRRTITWADPQTGLEVRCVAVDYADFPAVEWTVWFKNTGTKDTPILENIQGIDTGFTRGEGGEFVLHGNKGDSCTANSYQPYAIPLAANAQQRFAPDGGRPTNGRFPYYNLQSPGGGLLLAVGWPGQWATSFTRDATNGVRIMAGQELTRLALKPGEEIRSPLIVMIFWRGADVVEAQNLWRRWYLAYTLPRRADGETQPAMSFFTGYGYESDIAMFQTAIDAGIRVDAFWRDAGASSGEKTWYPSGGNWGNLGTWEVDKTVYPNGFTPLTDWLKVYGMEFILWFEPERVGGSSWLGKNHPEWVLGGLLNLGNPAARGWLVEQLDKIIVEQGVNIYRQDFNMDPLGNWRRNDTPDRQGVTENLHVQGYLAFWDELLRRHPGMLIDSCASGGRRNDLETMRRAVPLLRSDLIGNGSGYVEGNQGHTYGLASWLPFYGSAPFSASPYVCRSYYLPCFGALEGFTPANMAGWRKAYEECRRVAPMMLEGDYYPLTPYSLAHDRWIAWQFNRPTEGDGVLQAFRRKDCGEAVQTYRLRGLDPAATYEVTNFDVEGAVKLSGKDLMEKGLTVEIKDKPGAAVITWINSDMTRARIGVDTIPTSGEQPLPVRFDGGASTTPSGKIVAYEWDFGDGATSRDAAPSHTYDKAGLFKAKLTVRDDQGRLASARVSIAATPADTNAPTLKQVAAPGRPDHVRIVFSEPVNRADAETASNYAITPGIQVLAAALDADRRTVTLTTSPLGTLSSKGTDYTLTAKGIRDCARKPNVLTADTRQKFRYDPLFARWKLDDGKGLVAADVSESKLDGALKGGPAWTNVAGRTGLSFDGVDDIVEMPTHLEKLVVPFSFTFWVNPSAEQVEYANILGNHAGFSGLVMQQDRNNVNQFGFGYGDGRTAHGLVAAPLTAGTWQHVAIVCDGDKAFCYINGEEKSTGSSKGEFAPNMNLTFRLGQGYHDKRYFRGLLSDVRIYRMALSPADVQAVMKEAGEGVRR